MTRSDHRAPFWYALTETHRNALRAFARPRWYETESIIVRERDDTDFAVVILDGCVKVSTHANHGYRAVLGLRDAGDVVGELAGVDGGTRSATLSAMTPVEALILPAPGFQAFLARYPEAAALLHRTVSERLREADRHRAAAGSDPVQQRLAALLLRLGQRYGVQVDDGGILIELPLTQGDLAGLVLTSQRTLGRILEQWRARRLVLTGRRTILLLSPDLLREQAGS
jgi:CRP/FNR family transcriptional regulator, cyclic AMP receptor protein